MQFIVNLTTKYRNRVRLQLFVVQVFDSENWDNSEIHSFETPNVQCVLHRHVAKKNTEKAILNKANIAANIAFADKFLLLFERFDNELVCQKFEFSICKMLILLYILSKFQTYQVKMKVKHQDGKRAVYSKFTKNHSFFTLTKQYRHKNQRLEFKLISQRARFRFLKRVITIKPKTDTR